jgi:hypothetical protein
MESGWLPMPSADESDAERKLIDNINNEHRNIANIYCGKEREERK